MPAASTGRCNLYAEAAGLFVVGRPAVDALNRLDPGLTVATLPEFTPVEDFLDLLRVHLAGAGGSGNGGHFSSLLGGAAVTTPDRPAQARSAALL